MQSSAGVAVVLPVKAFDAAKQRLSPALSARDRARLARTLASGVASVVRGAGAELFVACDDDAVRTWALDAGASIAWTPGLGLDGAISAGVDAAITTGAEQLVVAHADLARPNTLLSAATSDVITLVPDRHRDGTNVMSFPTHARVEPSYGANSFGRHLAAATAVAATHDVALRVLSSPDLALDVDTVDDLRHPTIRKELPPWLPTPPANLSTRAG